MIVTHPCRPRGCKSPAEIGTLSKPVSGGCLLSVPVGGIWSRTDISIRVWMWSFWWRWAYCVGGGKSQIGKIRNEKSPPPRRRHHCRKDLLIILNPYSFVHDYMTDFVEMNDTLIHSGWTIVLTSFTIATQKKTTLWFIPSVSECYTSGYEVSYHCVKNESSHVWKWFKNWYDRFILH